MPAFFQGIASLAPDVQLVLALCLFAVILIVAVSPSTTRNFCKLFNSLSSFFTHNRKPPQEPPEQGAA